MGKRKADKGYVHKHNPNPKARESDERRLLALKNVEIKRLQNKADKLRQEMAAYTEETEEDRRKSLKIDPLYDLKGAARAARDSYCDPNFNYDKFNGVDKSVNLLELYKGRLWEHALGQQLLQTTLELAVALHNNGSRTKEAIKIMKELLIMDAVDTLCVRHRLLRCYLDLAEADSARALLDKHPDDTHCCFAYTRALIEHISLLLKEEGSSKQLCDTALARAYAANPYALWLLLGHEVVGGEVEDLFPQLNGIDCDEGTLADAFVFFDVDVSLWLDTDGAMEWLRTYVEENKLSPVAHIDEEGGEHEPAEGGEVDINRLFIDLYSALLDSRSHL